MSDTTEASVVIAAPAATVLDIIADFDAYPDWADQVKRTTVLAEDDGGWPVEVEFRLDAGVIKDTYVLAYEWDVEESGEGVVSWSLVRSDVLRALTGSYTLQSAGADTEVTYRLSVELAIPVVSMLRRKAERMIIDTALKGLKKHAESN